MREHGARERQEIRENTGQKKEAVLSPCLSNLYTDIFLFSFPIVVLLASPLALAINKSPRFLFYLSRQPRPQGAFPWLWGKAREKRPGDEVTITRARRTEKIEGL